MLGVAARKIAKPAFLKLALKTLTLSFLREPNTHSSAPSCIKYKGIGKISCSDVHSLNLKRYDFDTLPLSGIVGLDRSIEAEFASSDGNFLPRRARLLSLFWPVR